MTRPTDNVDRRRARPTQTDAPAPVERCNVPLQCTPAMCPSVPYMSLAYTAIFSGCSTPEPPAVCRLKQTPARQHSRSPHAVLPIPVELVSPASISYAWAGARRDPHRWLPSESITAPHARRCALHFLIRGFRSAGRKIRGVSSEVRVCLARGEAGQQETCSHFVLANVRPAWPRVNICSTFVVFNFASLKQRHN